MTARDRLALAGVAAALALVASTALGAGPRPTSSLRAEALPGPRWEGPQFIQADRRGAVFLLKASTLEVYPLTAAGRLGEPVHLKAAALEQSGPRLRAAMSPDGDWVLWEGARLRLFRDGEEEPIDPPTWWPTGVGVLRSDPLVTVAPVKLQRRRGEALPAEPPLVLRWTGKAWEPLVGEPLPAETTDPGEVGIREAREVALAGAADGSLWLAHRNAYRVRRVSAAGRTRLRLTVGGGEVQQRTDAGRAQKAFETEVKRSGLHAGKKLHATAASAKPVVAAVAEGRDGKMYFLVHEAGGEGVDFALDRYDPVAVTVERTPVALGDPGFVTMASGKDGLYIAAFDGQRGRWRLPWDAVEAAHWQPLEEVEIDGNRADDTPRPE